ncbi:hypothetical protein E5082_23850 [Streptomyces griseoluteus]|uniref:Nuclear transport factor 2 family protein n=1 Tax=Streptomyces griseoluteus TaxID=29306 RepID=A0A4Z1D9A7_STRGP|nr:hypothetical protein [Streptomyces griseoluteus]TGN78618.1 hypothetical protein E5082_23850 [Streptomyces griseoluteus]GHE96819.1 hypothetical protein GCM10017776_11940 [Streptomyces griseoluteus]
MSIRIRTTPLTVVALAGGLALAAVTPALAGTASTPSRPAAATSVQGDPRNVTQRVSDFYGAYIDAVWDTEDPASGAGAKALRDFYLSASARKKVTAWEKKNHADGILFAQNVPVKWKVAYTGSGMGHATSRVTLTWSDGKNPEVTRIDVQSDLTTRKITDLKPAE